MRAIASFVRQPALHFALLGTLLYLSTTFFPGSGSAEHQAGPRPTLEIATSRIDEAKLKFRQRERRPPTEAESSELLSRLVDEEVLFRHALELELHRAPVPQRRLAQIAAFVEPADSCGPRALAGQLDGCAPVDDPSRTAELALRAVELGLHEGDYVTRRVLIDSASRLIRGAARLIEPGEDAMTAYLEAHGEDFRGEPRHRISHVLLRGSSPQDSATRLAELRRSVNPRATDWEKTTDWKKTMDWKKTVAALAEPGLVPPHLPLLEERAIERRFGAGFARRIAELPAREWSGPVRSRYGEHLVFVHEHEPGRVPDLSEVAGVIRAKLREAAADRWLLARLGELRDQYQVLEPSELQLTEATKTQKTDEEVSS